MFDCRKPASAKRGCLAQAFQSSQIFPSHARPGTSNCDDRSRLSFLRPAFELQTRVFASNLLFDQAEISRHRKDRCQGRQRPRRSPVDPFGHSQTSWRANCDVGQELNQRHQGAHQKTGRPEESRFLRCLKPCAAHFRLCPSMRHTKLGRKNAICQRLQGSRCDAHRHCGPRRDTGTKRHQAFDPSLRREASRI